MVIGRGLSGPAARSRAASGLSLKVPGSRCHLTFIQKQYLSFWILAPDAKAAVCPTCRLPVVRRPVQRPATPARPPMRCPGSARDTRGGKLGAPYPHDASRPLVLVLVLHEATARAAPTPGDGARLTGGASSRLDEHHRLDLRRHPITGYMYGVDTLVIVVVVAGFAVKGATPTTPTTTRKSSSAAAAPTASAPPSSTARSTTCTTSPCTSSTPPSTTRSGLHVHVRGLHVQHGD